MESDFLWWGSGLHTFHFYPRSPHGERRYSVPPIINVDGTISIHALRMESDPFKLTNSTSLNISIHALRMESDIMM